MKQILQTHRNIFTAVVSFFLSAVLLISAQLPVYGASTDFETIGTEICNRKSAGFESIQAYVDEVLAKSAGSGSDWFFIALMQSKNRIDPTAYKQALTAVIQSADPEADPVGCQRLALALLAAGADGKDPFTEQVLANTDDTGGLMHLIWKLQLLNNGAGAAADIDALAQRLLDAQLTDGGWAVMGQTGDADVTAMAIQALSPRYTSDEAYRNAIDRSIIFLSKRQNADGGYISYGAANPETPAQVIVALCALGINPLTDQRFTKNNRTLLDSIKDFQTGSGRFCHTIGGKDNETASNQVYEASVALWRLQNNLGSLFQLDKQTPTTPADSPVPVEQDKQNGIRQYLILLLAFAGMIVFSVVFVAYRHKRQQKTK